MSRRLCIVGWLTVVAALALAVVAAAQGHWLVFALAALSGVVVATTLTRGQA